jgi:hypothetical protein
VRGSQRTLADIGIGLIPGRRQPHRYRRGKYIFSQCVQSPAKYAPEEQKPVAGLSKLLPESESYADRFAPCIIWRKMV